MNGQVPAVRPLRITPLLSAAALVQVTAVVLFALNVSAPRTATAWLWVGAALATTLATVACWEASGTRRLHPVAHRLWRQLTLVCLLVGLGTVTDVATAVSRPLGAVRPANPVGSTLYMLAIIVLFWALLRLPIGPGRQRDRLLRLGLDATIVTITLGLSTWYSRPGGSAPGT